jgi:hypothetical protein
VKAGIPDPAQIFTTLHELMDGNPDEKQTMDLHNNTVGYYAHFDYKKDKDISKGVMKLLKDGRLLVNVSVTGYLLNPVER